MGLGATVQCRCFAEGRTTPPPGPVRLDPNGRPELDVPYEGNVRAHVAFGRWRESCCEHPDMHQFCEDIANWPGYRGLQHALGQIGWERFPTLRAVLPRQNEGAVLATLAARGDRRTSAVRGGRCLRAGPVPCGHGYGRGPVPAAGQLGWQRRVHDLRGPGGRLGRRGPVLRVGGGGDVVFRSRRFSQAARPDDAPDRVVWTDLDSGVRFEPAAAIRGSYRSVPGEVPWVYTDFVSRLRVEARPVSTTDFAGIVGAMTRAFRAAIETGNPVVWD